MKSLHSHLVPPGLPWRTHHGKTRLPTVEELRDTAIVLTTYHTVSAEWRNGSGPQSSILFMTRWRRIVLDEGKMSVKHNAEM
jgi:hypothetical protein